ncbi:MAG: transcription elongation factor GreA [Dehalococcoidales bacterium]|nr:transcription elongation factor GreA [Dehalococcoidales bacterium]
MDSNSKGIKVAEAAACFIEGISAEERESFQQTISHFARWFGKDKVFCELMPPEIANYADRLAISDAEYTKKLEVVKFFLAYAKKEGFIKTNLSTHLKSKKCKVKNNNNNFKKDAPQKVSLTSDGYEKIKTELEELKKQRPQAIEEVSKAAADKDFRENAPLDAARERLSHLEGQIIELQELLKKAEIIDECTKDTDRAGIGDCVVLTDLSNMEKLEYTLVSTREYDPSKGKISGSSPLGKAIVGKCASDNIEVMVPAGKLCYKIEKIEHVHKAKSKK